MAMVLLRKAKVKEEDKLKDLHKHEFVGEKLKFEKV
jgi:hypothetical protein